MVTAEDDELTLGVEGQPSVTISNAPLGTAPATLSLGLLCSSTAAGGIDSLAHYDALRVTTN